MLIRAPWPNGQKSNSRPIVGESRRKLTDAFIHVLPCDWEAHGEEVLRRLSEENPVAYFKGMLSLLPKDVSSEGELRSDATIEPHRR